MMEPDDREHRELSGNLRDLKDTAPIGRISTFHHLFGIHYARELRDMKVYDLEYIARLAGSKGSMGEEISKGRNLAPCVSVKPGYHQ